MGKYLKDPEPRRRSGYTGDKPLLSEQAGGMPSSRPSPLRKPGLNPKQEIVDEVLRSISRRINHFGTGGGGVNALAADKVLIADLANNYTSDNVEGALAEIFTDLGAAAALPFINDANVAVQLTATGSVATTQHARNELVKYVTDFGAIVDGATDDAAAIQAAIDSFSATAGGTLIFPGLCGIGAAGLTITSKNNLTLLGLGPQGGIKILIASGTNLPGAAGLGATTVRFSQCTRSGLRNFYVDGDSKVCNPVGINQGTECFVANSFVTSSGLNAGIVGSTNVRTRIVGNTVKDGTGTSRGIWFGNTSVATETDSLFMGNQVTNMLASAIAGLFIGCEIVGNNCFSNGGSGITIGGDSQRTTISANVCRSNSFSGIQFDTIAGVSQCDAITVVGNICDLNNADGISLSATYDSIIYANVCRNNNADGSGTGHGIGMGQSKRINVVSNICYDSRAGGSRTQSSGIAVVAQTSASEIEDVILSGNICSNNLTSGIEITTSGSGTIVGIDVSHNTTPNNVVGGIRVNTAAVTRVSVMGNKCLGNGTVDLRVDTLDALIDNNIYATQSGVVLWTFTDMDTTPSVLGGHKLFRASNSSSNTITQFDDGMLGQEIQIIFANSNTTINTGGNFNLKASLAPAPGDGIITLLTIDGTLWREVSRSF